MSADDFIVTPWHVEGDIDYEKLIKQFGTEKISSELLERIKKITGEDHFMLKRGIFFSHRELTRILDEYEKGNKFFLYTGRGPSGHTHIGHLVPKRSLRTYSHRTFGAMDVCKMVTRKV
jgi:tryptophanyl-tRNA synthetase